MVHERSIGGAFYGDGGSVFADSGISSSSSLATVSSEKISLLAPLTSTATRSRSFNVGQRGRERPTLTPAVDDDDDAVAETETETRTRGTKANHI